MSIASATSECRAEPSKEARLSCSPTVDVQSSTLDRETKSLQSTCDTLTGRQSTYPLDDTAVFIKIKHDTYIPSATHQRKLRNNLLLGVGFLELANCGDFAANVWNKVPVPHFAIALMAIGGTAALFTSIFAFRDLRLSWRNVCFLREERVFLRSQKQAALETDEEKTKTISQEELDSWLSVNFRELGNEFVDRFVMDLLLGTSAVIVGIGTFLAIGGANRSVYLASNLMSGYIGNAPGALFGLINATWTGYLCIRFHQHIRAVTGSDLPAIVRDRMISRFHMMQRHNAISGISTLVSGAAGMVTATMWWGYVVLIPCIISQILCNYIWRKTIGYDRSLIQSSKIIDHQILKTLEQVISIKQVIRDDPEQVLAKLIPHPDSIDCFLQFIFDHDLFDDFCLYLLRDATWRRLSHLESRQEGEISISPCELLSVNEQVSSRTVELAKNFILRKGPRHFEYMERFLLERLGCYMYSCQSDKAPD